MGRYLSYKARGMWQINQKFELPAWVAPFEWVQIFFFIILLCLQLCLPCLRIDFWGNENSTWKWRRMWKSDGKVGKEERIRRERCCANDRDEWRGRARRRGLMPPKSSFLRTILRMRESRYRLRTCTIRFIRRFASTGLNDYLSETPFFTLPPEIREQIYVYYMLEWSSAGLGRRVNQSGEATRRPIPPHDPPLTRVSKLVRAESLHVFYRTARFPLIAHPKRPWGPLDLPFPAVDWYHHLGPGKLSLIRHLAIQICLRGSAPGFADSLVFHVDFERDGNKVSLVRALWALDELHQASWMAEHMQHFADELLSHFRSVAHSLGDAGIISAKDIYQFVA